MNIKNGNFWGFIGEQIGIENGRFVSVSDSPVEIDLKDRWIMPGFIDAHCHILPSGLDLLKLNLSSCETKEDVLDSVRDCERLMDPGTDWLLAVQYDQTKFEGAQHIENYELDLISETRPILLRHSNGHASVCNSAALRVAGVDSSTPDPEGGEYGKCWKGEPNGVLLEKAHEYVTSCVPKPTLEQMVEGIMRAGDSMAGYGITCATDMMTGRFDLERELQAYRIASEKGCKIRLRLSLQWATVLSDRKAIAKERLEELLGEMNPELCRMIGLKVFADGAIGSATAAIYGKYSTTGGSGQLIYSEENLAQIIAKIDSAGYACAVHTIGDRSTDLVMEAYEKTDDPLRHRIEHAMILSDEQIQRMAKLGSHLAMQPEFIKRFGHAYRAQIPELAGRLNRCRSVLDAGISLSFNSDRPIVPGNPWDGIEMAVDRLPGFDACENVTLAEAVDCYTLGGAVANREPEFCGRIQPGMVADFQIYDKEPTVGCSPSEVWRGGEKVV